MPVLTLQDIVVKNTQTDTVLVKEISFSLERNSCLAIVGESGSGKSLLLQSILGLTTNPLLQVTGSAHFLGQNLIGMKEETVRKIRGRQICMILQDAHNAFHPLYTIGQQLVETIVELHHISKKEAWAYALIELERMNIVHPIEIMKKYPHQLSGGMLQRTIIALSMAMAPEIIIADEPTTSLDSINQMEVMKEFEKIKKEEDTAIIFVTHDLGLAQRLADDVLVMKDGKQVEYGKAQQIFTAPKHEYTKYLLESKKNLTDPFIKLMGLETRYYA